jgi:Predicted metal-binding protein related to the C-terminal domain of SecA
MAPLSHRWSLGQAWELTEEQAETVAAGADPESVGAELIFRGVTCIDCHIDHSLAGGRSCVKHSVPIARNHPCPCGSGRKYRHCCGKGS